MSDDIILNAYLLNPNKKKTLIFLHGGPGLGFGDNDISLFSETQLKVVLYDQRNAGHSTKIKNLVDATPHDHIEDLRVLIDYLGETSVTLYGGSWGATLAVLFAIRYPEKVDSMILRNLYPATKLATTYFAHGRAVDRSSPTWQNLVADLSQLEMKNVPQSLLNRLKIETAEERQNIANKWANYAHSLLFDESENTPTIPANIRKVTQEIYYAANNCFVPDNHILTNIATVENIPTIAIHGVYNRLCPYQFVMEIYAKMKKLDLRLLHAGHLGSEPRILEESQSILRAL